MARSASIRRDDEGLSEYTDTLSDRVPQIEADVAALRKQPGDAERIASLFRALHNLKGDAALCHLEVAVRLIHPLESLLDKVRSGKLRFSNVLGEVVLLTVDRLEMTIEALRTGRSLEPLRLNVLVNELTAISRASESNAETMARKLIYQVTGFWPAVTPAPTAVMPAPEVMHDHTQQLNFFRTLALQLERRSPLFSGRTGRLADLAQRTNQEAGGLVDALQLEAAIYMHDIGMMFLPDSAWLKPGQLEPADIEVLHKHPQYAAGLLECMEVWSGAVEMVRQHHEMPDGSGYPAGLKLEQICHGARLIAILDAFEAVMLKHAQRGHGRSMLRAIAEINACEGQFDRAWVEPFNRVVRRMIESTPG